ncbi:acyltransferase [Shewanella intestini]|uniref:LpxL/LpxP family acyltransferase n=1 Tax=Shewanella TaxID=22 RepID=UPI001BB01036|nr:MULTISPECIES: acyltransferase [Shewanella]
MAANHWSSSKERGSVLGIKFMLATYRLLGRKAFSLILYPIIGYFYLFDHNSRQASNLFLLRVQQHLVANGQPCPPLSSFKHLYSFGQSILDKLAGWGGDITYEQLTFHNEQVLASTLTSNKGGLILGSHLGNLELCRALSSQYVDLKINALVFTQHAENVNSVMEKVNPDSNLNLIQVTEMGPDTSILLEQKLNNGEWVVIVGDRTSVTQHNRVVWQPFLGQPAPFPVGPFILAAILKHPVYLMFGFANQHGNGYDIFFEEFESSPSLPRANRTEALNDLIARYASRLEHFAVRYPLQWFNFFDFWKLDNDSK